MLLGMMSGPRLLLLFFLFAGCAIPCAGQEAADTGEGDSPRRVILNQETSEQLLNKPGASNALPIPEEFQDDPPKRAEVWETYFELLKPDWRYEGFQRDFALAIMEAHGLLLWPQEEALLSRASFEWDGKLVTEGEVLWSDGGRSVEFIPAEEGAPLPPWPEILSLPRKMYEKQAIIADLGLVEMVDQEREAALFIPSAESGSAWHVVYKGALPSRMAAVAFEYREDPFAGRWVAAIPTEYHERDGVTVPAGYTFHSWSEEGGADEEALGRVVFEEWEWKDAKGRRSRK